MPKFLTLLFCACGRIVSRGFSRSCVWPGSGPAGKLLVSLQSGLVYRTERAPWSSSRSIRRRSRHYWLRRGQKVWFRKRETGGGELLNKR